jgi:hypothetical protein
MIELVIKQDPKLVINNHVPLAVRAKFAQVVVNAYKWSEMLFNNTAAFKSIRGKKRLLPEIKNIAVEFFVMQAVKNRDLPFEFRINYNSNRSHPYLELFNDRSLIHFNQVKRKNNCGRKAFCRDRLIQPISSYINFEKNSVEYDDQLYFQLNHGYQSETPSFLTLGIPSVYGKFEASIQLLEEFTAIEGYYPKSTVKNIDDMSFEEFEQFAEGEVSRNEEVQSS